MGSNGSKKPINYLQMLGDVLLVNLGIVLSFWLRFGGNIPRSNFQSYINIIPMVSVMTLLIFNFYGLYHTTRKTWSEIVASLMASIAILTLLTIAVSYMVQSFTFPRSVFLLSALLQLGVLCIWRRFILRWERRLSVPKNAMIVTPAKEADELSKKAKANGYNIMALVTDSDIPNRKSVAKVGTYENVEEIYDLCEVDAVFMSGEVPEETKRLLVKRAFESGTQVYVIPSLYEIMLAGSRLDQISDTLVLEMGVALEPGKEQIKRLMDVILATVGLILTAPIMLIAAIAVKLDSAGPVFYRQERVSRGGKRFMVLKFRTMTDGAEKHTGPVLSQSNDPRVTRVGRVLRATRIDELPQLINVLKGDMSVVGPRPERPFFVEQFEQEIPEYSTRHTVKAGITGLAQVAGKYSTSPEDKLKYDLLYAKSASPLMDLRIMLQTIKVVLMRDKAS